MLYCRFGLLQHCRAVDVIIHLGSFEGTLITSFPHSNLLTCWYVFSVKFYESPFLAPTFHTANKSSNLPPRGLPGFLSLSVSLPLHTVITFHTVLSAFCKGLLSSTTRNNKCLSFGYSLCTVASTIGKKRTLLSSASDFLKISVPFSSALLF